MKIRNLALAAITLMVCIGCVSYDSEYGNSSNKIRISIAPTIEQTALKPEFVVGDSVGVFAINYSNGSPENITTSGNQADNIKFSSTTKGWQSSTPAYYLNKRTPVDIICYYPYMVITSINNQYFSVESDQTSGYEQSTLAWGKAHKISPKSGSVPIALKPLTSLVRLTLIEGDGWAAGEWEKINKEVSVVNTIRELIVDINTGEIKTPQDGSPSNIAAYYDGENFVASVVPQSINATTRLFTVKLGEQRYEYTLDAEITFASGEVYSFEMRVNKGDTLSESEKLRGTVIGTRYSVDYSTGERSETINGKNNLFDGDFETFFASYDGSKTWVGLDLGEPHVITRLGYSPRITQPARIVTAVIEGANNADFSDAIPMYIIKESAEERVMTYADIRCSRGFRYVRYVTPNDKRCNLAELEFYGYPSSGNDSQLYQLTNLPTVVINTANAEEITSKEIEITSTVYIISQDGTHLLCDRQTGVRGRGNASWDFPKKPYRLKFSEKRSPLGAPAEAKKWTLLSNYGDKTLMRNILAFEVSRRLKMAYTPFCQPVDLIVNGEYRGCYQLCDQIDVRENRVDITEMDVTDNTGINLQGGYLIEIDAYAYNEAKYFYSQRGTPVTIKSPDNDKITTEQQAYIENFFNTMEASIFDPNYTDPTSGYRKYLDLDSFLRHFIIGEFTGNTDTYWSVYMYKDRTDDKLHVGPVWDYDLAFENDVRTYPINSLNNYIFADKGSVASATVYDMVYRIVCQDSAAQEELKRIWQEAKQGGIEVTSLLNYIDETAALLEESQRLNFKRWQILYQQVHQNFQALGSYEAEVETIRGYIEERVDALDRLINR